MRARLSLSARCPPGAVCPLLLLVALAAAGATLLAAGPAAAGTPVQPAAGSVVRTAVPRFLVHLAPGEVQPVARVAQAGGGAAGFSSACAPQAPAGEPHMRARAFTCTLFVPLENGRYSWQLSYSRQVCRTVEAAGDQRARTCVGQAVTGAPVRFTVQVPVPSVALAPVELGAAAPVPAGTSHADAGYSRIASRISGRSTVVHCWNEAAWAKLDAAAFALDHGPRGMGHILGSTHADGDVIDLGPAVCGGLDALRHRGVRPTRVSDLRILARAVETLAHESVHAFGYTTALYRDEAEAYAECYGMQLMPWVAAQLGVAPEYARRLVAAVWEDYPLRFVGTAYFSSDCRNGARLDLDPASKLFP